MKRVYYLILTTITAFLIHVPCAHADRGDLIDHEILEYFESQDVVNFFIGQFESYIEPDDMPEFFELATAFFNQLIDQRNITVHKMLYETIDFYGVPVEASGIILIPGHENYTCTPSFSIYAHGTVFDREAVNSRIDNWGGEFMLTLMMAAINTITVAPDYYGLGDGDGFHHHNTYRTNVNSSLDAIRAGRNLCNQIGKAYNNRLMPMGYSEGGHASMGIARMVKEEGLQSEFNIPFVGAGSGAYDMSGEAFDFILGDPFYATPQYILYQAATCEDIYGNIILEEEGETYSDFLQPPYDALFEEHVLSQDGDMGWVTRPWTDMFQPDKVDEIVADLNHPLRQCLANSNVYQWNNRYPTLMYYCTTDEQVPYTGALKTRDVQRSLIPWFLFWERFKIQAINLTLGGVIYNHGICALPSIFLQVAFMDRNLGVECEFTGRNSSLGLRTANGERIDQRVIYSNKYIHVADLTDRVITEGKPIVFGMNMQTGNSISSGDDGQFRIDENGFYIFGIEQSNGQIDYTWLYKSELDFVNTDDYDPLLINPMNDHTMLDLSLITEYVNQVAVLDMDGNLIQQLDVNDEQNGSAVRIERTNAMIDGQYVVEVRTGSASYPLLLEVDLKSAKQDDIKVFPNPVKENLRLELDHCDLERVHVEIYDARGSIVFSKLVQVAGCLLEIRVKDLASGMYMLNLEHDSMKWSKAFIKATDY